MSEHDGDEHTEPHPEVTAELRDEPVPVDPIRREAAIDAALELSSTLFPVDTSTDELAARRSVAPVPAPRRAGRGVPRRTGLVAAAVLLVAGLGIAGVVASGGQDDMALTSGSAEDSASTDSSETVPPEQSSADPDDPSSAAESDDPSSAAESGEGFASGGTDAARGQEGASDQAVTTTAPHGEASTTVDAGTFASIDELLDRLVDTSTDRTSAAPAAGAALADGWSDCADELGRAGLTVTGRATVGSLPVWLAVAGPDGSVVVVLDASTCAELGRR